MGRLRTPAEGERVFVLGPSSVDRRLLEAFPHLAGLRPAARDALLAASREVTLGPGATVFEVGQPCERYLLITDGRVRVGLINEDGHEIVLYRIGRGETCILTTAALLGSEPYAASAVTDGETTATIVPAATFDDLLGGDAAFRRFVFTSHARRIADLMRVVSDVAFTRIQVRLARCLLARADPKGRVALTHEAIAVEIGTAREVVSRNLKLLEREGVVRLGQGSLVIADAGRLAALT